MKFNCLDTQRQSRTFISYMGNKTETKNLSARVIYYVKKNFYII